MDTKTLSDLKRRISTLVNVVESKTSSSYDENLCKRIESCLASYRATVLCLLDSDGVEFDPSEEYAKKVVLLKNFVSSENVSKPIEKLLTPAPFDGDILGFPAWQTTTLKLLQDSRISNDQKLLALKNSLKGTASKLVVNSTSWESALERLSLKFSEKKMVVDHCSSLIKSCRTNWSSMAEASEFIVLLEDVTNLFHSVKGNSCEEQNLLDVAFKKIPSSFRDEYIRNNIDKATLTELSRFLKSNLAGIVKISEINKKPESKGAKEDSKKRKKRICMLCGGDHHVFRCDTGSPSTRRALASKKNSCFVCFGKHSSKECKSTFKCKKCKQAHATILCEVNLLEESNDQLLN